MQPRPTPPPVWHCPKGCSKCMHCEDTRWDPHHAWTFCPSYYLSTVGKACPRTATAAKLGLALINLTTELKDAARVLMKLLNALQDAGAATEATLQSALHLCAKVHKEEILPAARFFTARGGAAPTEWARALQSKTGNHNCKTIDRGGVRQQGMIVDPTLPLGAPSKEDIAALPSTSQRALLRSLEAAGELGVAEVGDLAKRLSAQLCNCERLRQHAARRRVESKAKNRSGTTSTLPWEHAPWRCHTEQPVGTNPDLWHEALQPGPVLCSREGEINDLVPEEILGDRSQTPQKAMNSHRSTTPIRTQLRPRPPSAPPGTLAGPKTPGSGRFADTWPRNPRPASVLARPVQNYQYPVEISIHRACQSR